MKRQRRSFLGRSPSTVAPRVTDSDSSPEITILRLTALIVTETQEAPTSVVQAKSSTKSIERPRSFSVSHSQRLSTQQVGLRVMTTEEAAEIVMLGQYMDCKGCSGTGYVSWKDSTVKSTCMECQGLALRLRPHWYTAMYELGLLPIYSPNGT